MMHSTVNSIVKNKQKIINIVGLEFYTEIVYRKKKSFIIGTANQNLRGAVKLMNSNNLSSPGLITMSILQRIKGAIKSVVK